VTKRIGNARRQRFCCNRSIGDDAPDLYALFRKNFRQVESQLFGRKVNERFATGF